MILGVSSFAFAWSIGIKGSIPSRPLTEVDMVNKTLALGLRCLQLGDNLPLHLLDSAKLDHLKELITKNDIRLEVGARGLATEHLQRYIEIAIILEAPLLRFVIDGHAYEPNRDTIIGILKDFLPTLKKNSIILGIENHDRFKAKDLASIMDDIADDQIGICLDCVNSLGAGEGLDWVTDVLSPYTVNLHIKDFTIQRFPHNMGFEIMGAPTGNGMTEVPMLMEKLSHYNRCKSAVLEQWIAPEENIETAVRKEEQWAVEGIRYLKTLPDFNI